MKEKYNFLNVKDYGASGSAFEAEGTAVAGSNKIVLSDIGDFRIGQGIKILGGAPRCESFHIFGPHGTHANRRRINGEAEIRGWDGSNGDHVVYIIDIDPNTPDVFRWSDDRGRVWHDGVTLDREWHTLSGGLEIRLTDFDWSLGWVITIVMRSSITAEIMYIRDNVITIDNTFDIDVKAKVLHSDSAALQVAIDTAISKSADIYIPEGHYNLSESLYVKNPKSLTITGSSPERTVLDIGFGGVGIEAPAGSCIVLEGGEEVNVYDISFKGASGFDTRDQAGHLKMKGTSGVWGFYFMKCNAMSIWGTSRVYVENCHARGMSAECFYSASPDDRTADFEPMQYTKSITYMRCSVEDCARNAFNNNDLAENTHLIDCRVRNVGGCTWEGASRFVEMRGCYIRNAGCVGIGNVRSRKELHERLGTAQHIITDNTFESGCPYGGVMINVGAGASQVIIKNNNFVNFNSNAVSVNGRTGNRDLPPEKVTISGNMFNMTAEDTPSKKRTVIEISAPDVIVSDNQIYSSVKDENITAINIRADALGIIIHDNLIRGVREAIVYSDAPGVVGEVIDERHFLRKEALFEAVGPTLLRHRSHRYHGWIIVWNSGEQSEIEDFDPEKCIFTIKSPRKIINGEHFILKPRYEDGSPANEKLIHNNLII